MNNQGRVVRWVAWLIMIPLSVCLIAALILEALGLRVSDSRSVYAGAPPVDSVPALMPNSVEPLDGTTITIWFLKGPRFFSAETTFAHELARGRLEDGQLAYRIEFDEAEFNEYLHYWFLPPGDELSQYIDGLREPRVDLRPGGLALLADVQVGGAWQPIGLLYLLDRSATQLNFVGIEYQGSVLSSLPDSFMDEQVGSALERLANRALGDLTFIDGSGARLKISRIAIDEDRAAVLATEAE